MKNDEFADAMVSSQRPVRQQILHSSFFILYSLLWK